MTRDKLALVPDEDILALMLDKLPKNYHQGGTLISYHHHQKWRWSDFAVLLSHRASGNV